MPRWTVDVEAEKDQHKDGTIRCPGCRGDEVAIIETRVHQHASKDVRIDFRCPPALGCGAMFSLTLQAVNSTGVTLHTTLGWEP